MNIKRVITAAAMSRELCDFTTANEIRGEAMMKKLSPQSSRKLTFSLSHQRWRALATKRLQTVSGIAVPFLCGTAA